MPNSRVPTGQRAPLPAITDKAKLALPVGEHQDGKERSLYLRVNAGGKRSWFCQFWVSGQNRNHKENIGDATDMAVEVARRKVEEMKVEQRGAALPKGETSAAPTFKEVVEDHAKAWTARLAKLHFAEWMDKPTPLDSLTKETVNKRRSRILAKAKEEALYRDSCAGRQSRPDAGMTAVDSAGKALRSLLLHAAERMNFAVDKDLGKVFEKHAREPRRVWLNDDEAYDRVMAVLDNPEAHGVQPWAGPFFKIILLTATRKGVLLRARWTDIDLKRGLWTVPFNQSKNGETNFIHLRAKALALFKAQREAAGDSPFVFPSPQFDPMHFHLIDATPGWNKVREAAKVSVTIHDLRRTAISRMVSRGAPMKAVSVAAGHKNQKITEDVYGHLAPRAVHEALDLLE